MASTKANHLLILLSLACTGAAAVSINNTTSNLLSQEVPNDNLQPQPHCSETNWSNGSAFFTVTALALAGFAHPRGSIICNRSGRFWRFSPLLLIGELICIFRYIFSTREGRNRFPVVCYTLLSVRVGNSWHPYEYKEYLESINQNPREILSYFPDQPDVIRFFPNPTPKSTTTPEAEGEPTLPISSVGHEYEVLPDYYYETETTREQLLDMCFERHIDIVSEFEKGPLLRTFIWLPVVLQFIKLCVVSGGYLARAIGFIYLLAWLADELMLVVVANRPLSAVEKESAIKLGRQWRKPVGFFKDGVARSVEGEIQRKFWDASGAILPLVHFCNFLVFLIQILGPLAFSKTPEEAIHVNNGTASSNNTISLWSTVAPNGSATIVNRTQVSNSMSAGMVILLIILGIFFGLCMLQCIRRVFQRMGCDLFLGFFLSLVAVFSLVTPLWVIPLQYIAARLWKVTKLQNHFPLSFHRWIGELEPIFPAYIGLFSFVMSVFYFVGIGAWHFECEMTKKPGVYDWLS